MNLAWPAVLGLLLTVLSPTATGLAIVDQDRPGAVRLIVEDGHAWARALEGQPRVDDRLLSGEPTRIEEARLEPWRGYERTLRVSLSGTGRVLFTDEASGVVVTVNQSTARSQTSDEPAGAPGQDPPNHPASSKTGESSAGGGDRADRSGSGSLDDPVGMGEAPTRGGPGARSGEPSGQATSDGTPWRSWLALGSLAVLALAAPIAWRWYNGAADELPAPPGAAPEPSSQAPSWARLPRRSGGETLNPSGRARGSRRRPHGEARSRSGARARDRPAARRHRSRRRAR